MTRDYSEFLPTAGAKPETKSPTRSLPNFGWGAVLAQQTEVDEIAEYPPVRVFEVHRSGLRALGIDHDVVLPPRADATVGDWFLLNEADLPASRLLERTSLLKRRAPGSDRQVQLIAANVDTVFIVTSCNADFNVARLERYIAMVLDAGITPVIVLTKADLCDDPQEYVEHSRGLSDNLSVVTLDARGEEPRSALSDWCRTGQTVAFLGSSGVGKSTLTNALTGSDAVETQAIREDDARGRHTTTHRQLHFVPGGCVILDTPGMRELQLTDSAAGLETVFADFYDLATRCKFNDCRHETEPGCAILKAVGDGTLDEARLARWKKLAAEDAFNTASLSERRTKDRAFGKAIRSIQKHNRK